MQTLRAQLEKLGLRVVSIETYDEEQFKRLHRPVGKIELYSLADRVNRAFALTGRDERVSEGKFRSCYRPEMTFQPLVKFCEGSKFQPRDKKLLTVAAERVVKKFCHGKVKPISLEESYQRLLSDKYDHFAGLPTLGKKGDDELALKRAEQVWRGKCPPPAIILHRGKNVTVVRVVWAFPFEQHIVEGAFYYALYDLIKTSQSIYPVGVISERRYLMRKYCQNESYNTKFSIDYSGFDASLTTQMIGIAFSILGRMLDLTPVEQKNWERVQTYFTTCPFLAPDGLVYKGRRGGVPSGSMFTQLVDSVCNALAIEYAMLREGIRDFKYLVYGDDSWTILNIGEEPQKFLQKIESHVRSLGLRMNVDKTAYAKPDQTIVFCGHYDIRRGRPLQDAIDKMCYPERPSVAYTTSKGICERIMAYIADADSLELNAVFLSFYYNKPVEAFIKQSRSTNLQEIISQEAKGSNRRHLPGILQVIDAAPREASTLMKIRSAI